MRFTVEELRLGAKAARNYIGNGATYIDPLSNCKCIAATIALHRQINIGRFGDDLAQVYSNLAQLGRAVRLQPPRTSYHQYAPFLETIVLCAELTAKAKLGHILKPELGASREAEELVEALA
jgi:hypothetical protein